MSPPKMDRTHTPLKPGLLSRVAKCPYCKKEGTQRRVNHKVWQCAECLSYIDD